MLEKFKIFLRGIDTPEDAICGFDGLTYRKTLKELKRERKAGPFQEVDPGDDPQWDQFVPIQQWQDAGLIYTPDFPGYGDEEGEVKMTYFYQATTAAAARRLKRAAGRHTNTGNVINQHFEEENDDWRDYKSGEKPRP